jgi:hypothetical protein
MLKKRLILSANYKKNIDLISAMGALLTTMLLFVLIESASMKFLDSCRAERKWNETHVAIDGVHRRSAGADRRIGKTVPLCGQVALNCGLTVLNTRDNQQYLKTVDLNQAMLEAAAYGAGTGGIIKA